MELAKARHARVIVLAAALVACLGCSSSGGESMRTVDRPDFQRMLRELSQRGSGATVGLVQTDAESWSGASGNSEGTRRASPDDRFGIASTTKTFVATVVLQLVGEGRLSLEDSVERRLPGELPEGEKITVRQLLNHTSGLEGTFPGELPATGKAHRYSNANYDVLGLIVENVTGRRLAHEVRDRIFRPLGLDDTGYGTVAPKRKADRIKWLGTPLEFTGPVFGSGGIVSTADDLALFFRALFSGELLRPKLMSEMTRTVAIESSDDRAGLGIFKIDLPCGSAWGHGGDQFSYSDMPLVSDDGSKVVIVAQNTTGWDKAKDVATKMFCA